MHSKSVREIGISVCLAIPLALTFILGAPRVASALPCYDQCIVYFTDATYTQAVGAHLKSCWGLWYWQGTETEYKTTENVCCGNEPCWENGACQPDYWCSHDPCPPTPPLCPLRP